MSLRSAQIAGARRRPVEIRTSIFSIKPLRASYLVGSTIFLRLNDGINIREPGETCGSAVGGGAW